MRCPTDTEADHIEDRIRSIPIEADFYETLLTSKQQAPETWEDTIKSLWVLEETIFGGRTPELVGAQQERVPPQEWARAKQEQVQKVLGSMLENPNAWVRSVAKLILGFNKNIGKSHAYYEKINEYYGGMDYAEMAVARIQEMARRIVDNDRNRLTRVWGYLDPEFSGENIKWKDLDDREKTLVNLLRLVSNYVHDLSYYTGGISKEKWEENKGGRYIPREYFVFEFPPEVEDYKKKSGFGLQLGHFKPRGPITDWKDLNKITDPVYLLTSVFQQVSFNNEVKRIGGWLISNEVVRVADEPVSGFTKVPAQQGNLFGPLAGLWVRDDVYNAILREWDKYHNTPISDPQRKIDIRDGIKSHIESLAETELTSVTEKIGYKKLSNSPKWGYLSGRWVRDDVLDQLIGLHFNWEVVQKLYDVLNWWDRLPLRRFRKEQVTIMNPAVRLGNKVSNFIFSVFLGLNPIKFIKNKSWAAHEVRTKGMWARAALKTGMLGFDDSFGQASKYVDEMTRGITKEKDPGLWKEVVEKLNKLRAQLRRSYTEEDDIAKLAAFKTFLDSGIGVTEARRLVMEGYQNYRNVGFLYEIGSKLPILGNPFVRFQAELIRIAANNMMLHPIRTLSVLIGFKFFQDLMSRVSKETPEEREVREARPGTPHLPFVHPIVNYPLTVQTPWGEVNAARLVGLYAYSGIEGSTVVDDFSRLMPVLPPELKNVGSDPVLGPLIASFITDTDFKGKSIKDPEMDKYRGSMKTWDEQMWNRFTYLLRQYGGPVANSTGDLILAQMGKEASFGRELTPLQAVLRLWPGIKIEEFGPEQVKKYKEELRNVAVSRIGVIEGNISRLKGEWTRGEITGKQAIKRITAFSDALSDLEERIPGAEPYVKFFQKYNSALLRANEWEIARKSGEETDVKPSEVARFYRLSNLKTSIDAYNRRIKELTRKREATKDVAQQLRYQSMIDRTVSQLERVLEAAKGI